MLQVEPITPAIGAIVSGIDFSTGISDSDHDYIYQALIKHLVIFIRDVNMSPAAHLNFAQMFGDLDDVHPHYPHVDGHENIVVLENDANRPPDTNSWHTDLTYKQIQPFASILVARHVPSTGGDTLWSSCYSSFDRLPDGMKRDLENIDAVHDLGDFRNRFAHDDEGQIGSERLNKSVPRFGHSVRPLIGKTPGHRA